MKFIRIKFLTEKGERAYFKIEEEGNKQPFMDRKISNMVFSDKVVSKDPLVVLVDVKIEWMAIKIDLRQQIIEGLNKKGCVLDKDFVLEEG